MDTQVVEESRETATHTQVAALMRLFDTPWDTNMFMEFVETLVRTDEDVTPELANRVWLAMSTHVAPHELGDMLRKAIATSFLASEDPTDLAKRWEMDLLGEFV